jgi:hypothetical protein
LNYNEKTGSIFLIFTNDIFQIYFSALWQAFERRQQLNESSGEPTNAPVIDQNAPPLLQRFDSSTRELAEAMNCLLALSDPTPANV